jgi:hypothetical protein
MNFVRGQEPKESMGIGLGSILKEIGGIILKEDSIDDWKAYLGSDLYPEREELRVTQYDLKNKNVIIGVSKGRYEILKNRFGIGGTGDEKDLITVLLKILEAFRKCDSFDSFVFPNPNMQRITARTIGSDLVNVKPLSGPIGHLAYTDYRYKRQNIFQKVRNKIFPTKPSKKPNI